MALFADLLAAIPVYTGLSPVSFFTLAALLITLYYLISGFFAAPKHSSYVPMEPLPPPVQLGDVTEEDLRAYDGTDPKKPLLMAIKGSIYDVSQSRMFYGPGGPYALFAGKDASRALAKMSFEEQDLNGNLEGLGDYEKDALRDWEWKFQSKYVKVGQIKNTDSSTREVPVTGEALDAANVTKDVEDVNVSEEAKADAEEAKVDASEAKVDTDVDDSRASEVTAKVE